MQRSFILSLACTALLWAVALPVRVVEFAFSVFAWLNPRPLLQLFSAPKPLLVSPAGHGVSPALYQRNRHEAGLARLGAVRHR